MSKHTERLEIVAIDKLKPYENNARTHSPEQIDKLRASLREFGFVNPILIDSDYGIIAGHGRLMAAQAEGMTEVPCVFVEHLTDAQKRAYILADNRLAELAGWNIELLQMELLDLEVNFDMSDFGFEIEPPSENKERIEANYDENISVLVKCEDEAQAQTLFDRLTGEGYVCQVSTL
jgi:ParB-like chromosome segregation protein Spo0J